MNFLKRKLEIKEVIAHCKSGNQIAQGILFDTYYRQMFHLSKRILINHNDIEDVLITAFTKVFTNIQKFEYRGDQSLVKWIKTIVINESIRQVNLKRPVIYKEDLSDYEIGDDHYADMPDVDVEQIYSIIEAMPDGYRIVFNMFAIEGYSHKEISEMLNIRENTSKSQLRKARIHIIEKINKQKKYGNA